MCYHLVLSCHEHVPFWKSLWMHETISNMLEKEERQDWFDRTFKVQEPTIWKTWIYTRFTFPFPCCETGFLKFNKFEGNEFASSALQI